MGLRGIIFITVSLIVLARSFKQPREGFSLMLALILAKPIIRDLMPEVYTTLHAPLVVGCTMVSICVFSARVPKISPYARRCFGLLSLFVLACWSTTLMAHTGVHRYLSELTNMWLLLLIGVCSVTTKEDVEWMHRFLLWTVLVLATVATYHYRVLGWQIPLPSRAMVDRNEFSSLLAACVPLYACAVLSWTRLYERLLALVGLMLMFLCVIPSYSRGAFLSLLMAILLCVKMVKNRRLFCLMMGILLVAGYCRVSDSYLDRLSTTTDYAQEASAAGRLGTYGAAWAMFKSAPLMGVGVGQFNDNFWAHCPEQYRSFCAPGKSVHNVYLQVLSETGVVGFGIFLLFLGYVVLPWFKLFKGPRLRDDQRPLYALGAACVVLLFAYLLLPGAYNSPIYLFCSCFIASQASWREGPMSDA